MKFFTALSFISAVLFITGCAGSRKVTLQHFQPVPVDILKIDNNDLSEVEQVINDAYAGGEKMYTDLKVTLKEGQYIYIHAFSRVNESDCYRATVDRNRAKIVNLQPNCP